MGIFDIFNTSDQTAAANAQIAGINAGVGAATPFINSGTNAITSYGAAALQPFLTNYGQAQGGVTQLQNLLGLNGTQGNAQATQYLNATPGYSWNVNQGNNAINAEAAATGQNGGNQALALSKFNQGQAGNTYQAAVSNLMPFLQSSNSNAAGIANINMGIGSGVANQDNSLAGLNYTAQTGIGNANANADLAGLTASGNIMNLIGSLGGAALGSIGGGVGGGLGTGINSALFGSSPVAGASGPTSVGGAPLSGGTIGGNLFGSIFSDVNLKENIERVGKLDDGTNVYRYNYKGDTTPQIGVMAQEVEQTRPDAVSEIGGFKAVHYGKATDLAASLAKFVDGNVVAMPRHGPAKAEKPVDVFTRFIEAA